MKKQISWRETLLVQGLVGISKPALKIMDGFSYNDNYKKTHVLNNYSTQFLFVGIFNKDFQLLVKYSNLVIHL
jgi:hypothetical protein